MLLMSCIADSVTKFNKYQGNSIICMDYSTEEVWFRPMGYPNSNPYPDDSVVVVATKGLVASTPLAVAEVYERCKKALNLNVKR